MAQYVEAPTKTFTCGAAIAQHLRVKFSSGKMAVAGLTDREIGTMEEASFADLDDRAVRLASAQGTVKMVANAALALGASVFTAAAGKVGPSLATGYYIGQVVGAAATADGDVVEVLRQPHGDTPVP